MKLKNCVMLVLIKFKIMSEISSKTNTPVVHFTKQMTYEQVVLIKWNLDEDSKHQT